MMKLNFKEGRKDLILIMVTGTCFLLAFIGLCVGSVFMKMKMTIMGQTFSDSATASFADLADATATAKAGLAFSILGFIALTAVVAFVVLEIIGKTPKITKYKMWASFVAALFIIIAFSCIAGFAGKMQADGVVAMGKGNYVAVPAAGAFLFFFFGLAAAICPLWINRGLKFWENK